MYPFEQLLQFGKYKDLRSSIKIQDPVLHHDYRLHHQAHAQNIVNKQNYIHENIGSLNAPVSYYLPLTANGIKIQD